MWAYYVAKTPPRQLDKDWRFPSLNYGSSRVGVVTRGRRKGYRNQDQPRLSIQLNQVSVVLYPEMACQESLLTYGSTLHMIISFIALTPFSRPPQIAAPSNPWLSRAQPRLPCHGSLTNRRMREV